MTTFRPQRSEVRISLESANEASAILRKEKKPTKKQQLERKMKTQVQLSQKGQPEKWELFVKKFVFDTNMCHTLTLPIHTCVHVMQRRALTQILIKWLKYRIAHSIYRLTSVGFETIVLKSQPIMTCLYIMRN